MIIRRVRAQNYSRPYTRVTLILGETLFVHFAGYHVRNPRVCTLLRRKNRKRVLFGRDVYEAFNQELPYLISISRQSRLNISNQDLF